MAGVQHHSTALLLKDSVGDKGGSLFNAFRKKKENVLRGSLLVGIILKDVPNPADGKPDYNYRLHNEEIFIHCLAEDIAPLTDHEFDLLCGIKSPGARFDAFKNDLMDWGSQLRVNDKVYVTLSSQHAIATQPCQAIIRWTGFLPSNREEGIQFGVEIIEEQYRGKGSTNGIFRNQQLFLCDNDCGLFVALDRLAPDAEQLLPKTDVPHSAQPPKSLGSRLGLGKSNEIRSSIAQGPSAGTRSQTQKKKFKKGDRVVAYNKDQIPVHGTVKWTGEAYTDDGKINAVGIETDASVQKEDFLIALTGLRNNFKCEDPKRGKVVLPEGLVQLELEMIEEKRKRQEEQSKQHEGIHRHLEQNEQEMLREAEIETKDLNPNEQEKLFREYKQKQRQDDKLREKNIDTVNNLNRPGASKTTVPRQFSAQEQVKTVSSTGREINRVYDTIPHSSSTGDLLQQPSQSNDPPAGGQFQEKKMLRDAKIETRAINRAEQERMFKEYNRQRDEKRKNDSETARNSSSGKDSSVDPTDKNPLPPNQSSVYQNMPPQSDNTQFSAFAPPQNDPHKLTMNSRVQFNDPPVYGVIHWMGDLPGVNGLIAGVELEENMDGCTDGIWRGRRYFSCKFGRGFFCPVSNFKPDQRGVTLTSHTPSTTRPSPYPRGPSSSSHGYPDPTHASSHGYPDPTHASSHGCREDTSAVSGFNNPGASGFRNQGPSVPTNISVGTAVEVGDPRSSQYGTLRWVGHLPGREVVFAGLEMEETTHQFGDGSAGGIQYFQCSNGQGYFCPLSDVRIDQRFADSAPPQELSLKSGNPLQVSLEESEDQQVPPLEVYLGEGKGIQGNQNSCYLDSTLFGLFALSDIFDEMFLEMTTSPNIGANRKAVSEMLWKGIVNPLRRNGVVRYESVMMMRNKLEELGKMEGITEKEKDPEEFLNMLFKHVLQTPAFIFIRRPFGVEKEFFVQLFVEHDPTLQLPTVEELIQRMFKEQQISFTKIPSKLLLQVPRFGREFKTYKKVIPNLRLDILEVTDTARVPECMFCGERSFQKCSNCKGEFSAQVHDGCVYFCSTCSARAHQKKDRKSHALQYAIDKLELYKLDLLSVICIETSHYVCFTRDPRDETWIFFDSMANRVYDTYNIPRVTDCTRELNEWVYSGDRTRLMSTQPRQLPELVRRFTQDIYMCVYIQPDVAMYGDPDGQ